MSYNISSKQLDNPLLKDLLKELYDFFRSIHVDFYIIGATARDLILCNLYDLTPNRKKNNLLPNVDIFEPYELKKFIQKNAFFSKNFNLCQKLSKPTTNFAPLN